MTRLLAIILLICPAPLVASEPTPAEVRDAVANALPLLQKGAAGHIANRACYACHNQGPPLLALTTARSRGFPVDDAELQKHAKFITAFLAKNRDNYLKGRGQGGQADTAGYALWTLELCGHAPDETTAAVAEYLTLYQKDKGAWQTTSNRPPSEASPFGTSYFALRGLQNFASDEQLERAQGRLREARAWLATAPAKDTEDRVFRLWALKRLGFGAKEVGAAAQELLKTQHEGGGWAQLDKMEPDAYATGTALVALHEAGGIRADEPAYRRGVRFLLDTQQEDGSWHVRSRSKPFQLYFETGFPHGKDQFISSAASGWATAALALSLERVKE